MENVIHWFSSSPESAAKYGLHKQRDGSMAVLLETKFTDDSDFQEKLLTIKTDGGRVVDVRKDGEWLPEYRQR